MNNKILLERAYMDKATIGKMVMPSGRVFDTIELPWEDNKQNVSCIPEGSYLLKMRNSGVVTRSSRGRYTAGWEVTNVEGRTYIMIHIGNRVNDFRGCIGVGLGVGVISNDIAILHSSKAFDLFMEEMKGFDVWELDIKTRTIEYKK
jgi:hypothetical protein